MCGGVGEGEGGEGGCTSWLVSLELFFLSDVFDENGFGREVGFGGGGLIAVAAWGGLPTIMAVGGRESVTVVHCGGGEGGVRGGLGWDGVTFFVLGRSWKSVIHACRFLLSESVIGGGGKERGGSSEPRERKGEAR